MKKLVALLLALVMAVGLVGCTQGKVEESKAPEQQNTPEVSTPVEAKEVNVLFLASSLSIEYFTNAFNAFESVFKENGINLFLKGPTQPDQTEEQLAMFENAVSSGEYDLILLYPAVPSAFVDAVRKAEEQGVPVIAYHMAPELECGTYYAGSNNTEQGKICAQNMIDFVDANEDHFGSMDKIPVVMWTTAASAEILKRADGIKEVLAADGRFEIVMEQAAVGTEGGMAFGETALTAYPDVELYIGVQDSAGVGVYNALKAAGKNSQYMGVFSVDGTGAVLSAIKSGEIYRATVGTPFDDQAPELAQFILDVVNGKVEKGYWSSFTVFSMNIDNVDKYLEKLK